jgi:Synapsin, N-terminal domain
VQSLTGAARDQGASIIGAAASTVSRVQAFNKDRCFTLLVIDDQNTDWSKYFRGKRLHGDYDIRVEQAEFGEISVTASGENGPTISIVSYRSGSKVIWASSLCIGVECEYFDGTSNFLYFSFLSPSSYIIELENEGVEVIPTGFCIGTTGTS